MFVIHVPINGERFPFIENVFENLPMNMYTPHTENPSTKCQAIPPRILRDAIENPMIVSMMIENGSADLLNRSTSYTVVPPAPLFFCLAIKALRSGVAILSLELSRWTRSSISIQSVVSKKYWCARLVIRKLVLSRFFLFLIPRSRHRFGGLINFALLALTTRVLSPVNVSYWIHARPTALLSYRLNPWM